MNAAQLLPPCEGAKFLDVPYEERWERLKDVIVPFYLGPNGKGGRRPTMSQVAAFMKENYSFSAMERQYQHRFKKWAVRKNMPASAKEEIVKMLRKRGRYHATTTDATLDHSEQVDKKKLCRYLKDRIRYRRVEPILPGAISSWNLPYAAYVNAFGAQPGQGSPFDTTGTTPPPYPSTQSFETTALECETTGLSPTTQLINQKVARDRASYLFQGRHMELLRSCGEEQRILLTNHLHDFHIQCYVKAKYWGRGPKEWTPGMISALTLERPWTPGQMATMSPGSQDLQDKTGAPNQLCQWSRHLDSDDWASFLGDHDGDDDDGFDLDDPNSWRRWSDRDVKDPALSMVRSMTKSLGEGSFSRTPQDSLPISTQSLLQSLQQHPDQLRVDAVRTAIMAANAWLVRHLFEEAVNKQALKRQVAEIDPFHLAAAYLDGGNACCDMIVMLSEILGPSSLVSRASGRRPGYIDQMGHTLLDAFMISILRSHTNVAPDRVSRSFHPPNCFPGEEKDICGRWDAISPAVRAHFQRGYPRIPSEWKHAFCHTAVQAICHSITDIMLLTSQSHINTPSGLFVRRCNHCGLKLELGPLHTLVVVAFYLAHEGMQGETLFGPLAILVCLLTFGANPEMSAIVSANDIIGATDPGRCCHRPMTAAEFMEVVPASIVSQWSPQCQVGWRCILLVLGLRSSTHEKKDEHGSDGEREPCDLAKHENINTNPHEDWEPPLPRGTPMISTLWATIQAEFLTYRRMEEGQSWISDNFSMEALQDWLEGRTIGFETPLITKHLLKPYSRCCGWFLCLKFEAPVVKEVCAEDFTNMDTVDDGRVAYLERLEYGVCWDV